MTKVTQCENCGAPLLPEDVFCGECGAPHPSTAADSGLVPAQPETQPSGDALLGPVPQPTPAPASASAVPPSALGSGSTGWRVAASMLLVAGIIACLAGVVAFFLFGSLESETTTRTEDWLFSAFCCLLPIAGAGAILLTAGVVIWFKRVRTG